MFHQLSLRPLLPSDETTMLDILTSKQIRKSYMLPDFPQRSDAYPLFCRMMQLSRKEDRYVRGVCLDDHLIGHINDVDISYGTIELGYVIHPDFQNRGYMSKALRMAIEELFRMGFQQIKTGAFAENLPSLRVMEKCGMARMPESEEITYRGLTHRCVYYSIKKQE